MQLSKCRGRDNNTISLFKDLKINLCRLFGSWSDSATDWNWNWAGSGKGGGGGGMGETANDFSSS